MTTPTVTEAEFIQNIQNIAKHAHRILNNGEYAAFRARAYGCDVEGATQTLEAIHEAYCETLSPRALLKKTRRTQAYGFQMFVQTQAEKILAIETLISRWKVAIEQTGEPLTARAYILGTFLGWPTP